MDGREEGGMGYRLCAQRESERAMAKGEARKMGESTGVGQEGRLGCELSGNRGLRPSGWSLEERTRVL